MKTFQNSSSSIFTGQVAFGHPITKVASKMVTYHQNASNKNNKKMKTLNRNILSLDIKTTINASGWSVL